MAGRALTRDRYEKVVAGFREAPGNAAAAARFAGVDRATAARLWKRGRPDLPWARPVRDVLADEANDAKAKAAARLRAETEAQVVASTAAREANVRALTEEEHARAIGRRAVHELALVALDKRDLFKALISRIESEVSPKAPDGSPLPPTISMKDTIAAVRELTRILEGLPALAKQVTESGIAAREETGSAPGRPGDDALLVGGEEDLSELQAELEANFESTANMFCGDMVLGERTRPKLYMSASMRRTVRRLAQELEAQRYDDDDDAPELTMLVPAVEARSSPEPDSPRQGSAPRIKADLYTLPRPGDDGEPEPTEERLVVERTQTVTQERVELSRRPVDPQGFDSPAQRRCYQAATGRKYPE